MDEGSAFGALVGSGAEVVAAFAAAPRGSAAEDMTEKFEGGVEGEDQAENPEIDGDPEGVWPTVGAIEAGAKCEVPRIVVGGGWKKLEASIFFGF